MKVLYIINNLTKGGAERFVLDLISSLSLYPEIDYRLVVLDDTNHYQEYNLATSKMINIEYQPFSYRRKNVNPLFKKVLDNFKPDIIHTNLFLSEFVTAYDLRKDITYVCHGHDNMHQFNPLKIKELFKKEKVINRLDYFYLKRKKYAKFPTYFIANSQHTYQFYKKNLPSFQKDNLRLIQYGFNYEKYYQVKTRETGNKIRLLNIGSFQPKKNQPFILDIAESLRKKGADFEINLIGHGSEYINVEHKIREKQLGEYVFLRGLQSNVEDWYRKSDIYLHTAYYEPFGLVFLEAMAAGLPVVCLDGKGNRDIIEDGKNGYLFYEQNPEAFAERIIELSSNESKYLDISKFAQAYAKQFDLKVKTKEIVDFYYSILKSK